MRQEDAREALKVTRVPLGDEELTEAKRRLRAHGFCLILPPDSGADAFMQIARHFGTIQSHIRADANGLVGGGESRDTSWKDYKSEYIGTVTSAMAPHCDGTFLDGAIGIDGTLHRVLPPAMLLLQCVHSASNGGEHLVVDGALVLEDMLRHEPESVRVLMTPGCVAICRDDQLAAGFPVLARLPDGSIRLRFRFDGKTYAPAWAQHALRAFHERTLDPAFCHTISQRAGEILVLDNHRALHGRTAFENRPGDAPRMLRRAWIRDDDESLLGVEDQQSSQRALDRYVPYGPVGDVRDPVPTGIHLPPERLQDLDALLGAARKHL